MIRTIIYLSVAVAIAVPAVESVAEPLLDVMADELTRAMTVLRDREDAPHYAAMAVLDETSGRVAATSGTLDEDREERRRYLDVDLRVGTTDLDSTHPMRGSTSSWRDRRRGRLVIPRDDDPEHALRHAIWREIDASYRDAAEAIVMVRANQSVMVQEEDPAADFEPRQPVQDHLDVAPLTVDHEAWKARVLTLSARLDASDVVQTNSAELESWTRVTTFVDSEGTALVHGSTHVRVALSVGATADDGDRVSVYRYRDAHAPGSLPDDAELEALADECVAELESLLAAPRGQPYSGPVILRGRAAAVFIHEVLGHRLEGHRQKRESEGKTFKEYVGKPILPAFVDIVDDPTLASYAGVELNGHYTYDDEGVAAQRTVLVDDGVLQGFLMGRSPIEGYPESNGHGRRSAGKAPVSRMGNLILETEAPLTFERLRALLLEEVRRQGAPYGIIVDEIAGGFTMTGRFFPNSFNVRALTCWRIYPDGRPDELVRGIDLVGTPLEAFGNLVATGDDPGIFNGYCGAESGSVPVGGASPSLLFSSLEFQLKNKGSDRPPLLDKPGVDPDGTSAVEHGGAR